MPFFKKIQLTILILLGFTTNVMAERCVILLHGLGRTYYSMASLATILNNHNYLVVNHSYPSTQKTINDLANQYLPAMISECLANNADEISFVTHSLGGIVLRKYLQNNEVPNLFRIVMLAPPNHGSKLADILHDNLLFKLTMGPAGQELTTAADSTPNTLAPIEQKYQVGIIAGNYTLLPMRSLFNEANDGKVAISSTKLQAMKDFIIVNAGHTFIMNNSLVQQQILNFLEKGEFAHTMAK